MKLYEDKISSAVARVRIAMALKKVTAESEIVPIVGDRVQTGTPEYRGTNPQGLVPALATDRGDLITQSLAIIEYLEECHPAPSLLPNDPVTRAHARAIALAITAEIHALVPPRISAKLLSFPGITPAHVADWKEHWITHGLSAVEALLKPYDGCRYAVAETPTIADIFLYPQAINAERAGIKIRQWPRVARIVGQLNEIPAFLENAPLPLT
ncbi:MAG: maleylacetoacetate isomerase [Thalassospira sp.]|uniref:maleylacetoacetate isomerase n=1 Tax=Thalassospira sp. TaxID=1912094 RepID=UPI000C555A96|nr:maleylacetoacetate isomerase [Thalassospira sp.]MAZ32667.1 maleylacetoacetate isomerase [Thalassospira sp.]